MVTYKFRIKDSTTAKKLNKMADSVNFVWNYCNETSIKAIRYNSQWLSGYDFNYLTYGCSKELGLNAQSIQAIGEEYANQRNIHKKLKLKWRTLKRSLGWIPFKAEGIKVLGDRIIYYSHTFKVWKSRPIKGDIKTGSFTQDSKGHWYVCLQCEIKNIRCKNNWHIGIDLGIKTNVTCSDGRKFSRENLTLKYEQKLAIAQRAHKKKLIKTIYSKIKNKRKDWNHKVSTQLVKNTKLIVIGDINSKKLMRTKLAKSVSDVAWSQLKSMFVYKAKKLGIDLRLIDESFSTQTCSKCKQRTGPKGSVELRVREWICSNCGSIHDRDINAAKNILRMGLHTPVGNFT